METSVYLPNGAEADCVTPEYAIEVDFTGKWAEAIGQSLLYASELERLPGIILICRQSERLCLGHQLRLEQAVNYWRIGMIVWLCDVDSVRLDECTRRDLMQE